MSLEVRQVKPPTVAEALAYLRSRLPPTSDCTDSEARTLLKYGAGLDSTQILAHPERRLSDDSAERVEGLLMRRLAGEPLAYVVGRLEFCGLDLAVDWRALIPRPETELMAELVRRIYSFADSIPRLAIDIGTGSGCLALALARWFADCTVIASDISPAALSLARENLVQTQSRIVHLVAGDGLAPFRTRFDLVVANLPYVPQDRLSELPEEVSGQEPSLALDGGADGLAVYRRVFGDVGFLLDVGGVVVFEMDGANVAAGCSLLRERLPGRPVYIVNDQFGRARFLVVAPAPVRQAARSLNLELVQPG